MNAGKAGENLGYAIANGSVTAGAVQNVSGPNSSNAYYFDGTTALSVAVNVYLKNVSLTFWAKNGTYALNTDRHLFGCSDEPPGQTFGIYHPSGATGANTLSYALGGDPALGIYNFTDTNWHYFVLTYNSGTQIITSYVDNTLKASLTKAFPAYAADACGKARSFLAAGYTGAATGLFSVDDFGLWNRTLNSSESSELYGLAIQNKTPFNQSAPSPPVVTTTVTFVSQVPADLTSFNAMSSGLNVTYQLLDGVNDNMTLFYFHNSTLGSCIIKANQTCLMANNTQASLNYSVKTGNYSVGNYTTQMSDNIIYPAVYGFPNERDMEIEPKQRYTMNTTSTMVKLALYNVSSAAQYNYYEIFLNASIGGTDALVYYCNSSYTTGGVSASSNCFMFYSLPRSQAFNHTHGANSWHKVFPLPIIGGLVGSVQVTPLSYFMTQRGGGNDMTVNYITNITAPGTNQVTTDSGTTWQNLSGSFDSHLHQYAAVDHLCHFESNNMSTNSSPTICDNLDLTPFPPGFVTFYSPVNGTVFMNTGMINFSNSTPVTGIVTGYNIGLCNPDLTYNTSIFNLTGSQNTTYNWPTTTTQDGSYRICVDANTNQSLYSRSYSQLFTIDNTPPFMVWNFPSRIDNSSQCIVGDNCQIDVMLQDANLYGYEINITNGAGILKYNNSQVNVTKPSFQVVDAFIPNSTGMFKVTILASDSHTKKLIEDYDVVLNTGMMTFSKKEKGARVSSKSASVKYTGTYGMKNYGAKKEFDRYVFSYNLTLGTDKGKKASLSFQAACPGIIEIPDDYIAHFLCTGSNQWIDFQNPHVTKYWTTSCGTDCYNIFMETDGTEDLEFRSIGGININVESAYINVTQASSDTVLDWMTCPSSVQGQMSLWFACLMIMGMLWFCFRFGLWVIGWLVSLGGIFWSAVYGGCNNIISGFTGFFFILVCLAFLMIMIFRLQLVDFRKMTGK
jgi:hypothetical protein